MWCNPHIKLAKLICRGCTHNIVSWQITVWQLKISIQKLKGYFRFSEHRVFQFFYINNLSLEIIQIPEDVNPLIIDSANCASVAKTLEKSPYRINLLLIKLIRLIRPFASLLRRFVTTLLGFKRHSRPCDKIKTFDSFRSSARMVQLPLKSC